MRRGLAAAGPRRSDRTRCGCGPRPDRQEPTRLNFAAISSREELEAIRHGSAKPGGRVQRLPRAGDRARLRLPSPRSRAPLRGRPSQGRGGVRDTFRPPPGYRRMSGRGTGGGIPRPISASRPRAIGGRRRDRHNASLSISTPSQSNITRPSAGWHHGSRTRMQMRPYRPWVKRMKLPRLRAIGKVRITGPGRPPTMPHRHI